MKMDVCCYLGEVEEYRRALGTVERAHYCDLEIVGSSNVINQKRKRIRKNRKSIGIEVFVTL